MPRLRAAVLVGTASFLCVLLLQALGLVDRLELITLDARYASGLGRKPASEKIVIAWIDQESIDYLADSAPFPWPREVHAAAMEYVLGGGARAVVFDVLFDQRGNAESDRVFGEALQQAPHSVVAFKFVGFRDGGRTPDETARFAARALPDRVAAPSIARERGVVLPIDDIEAGASSIGFVNVRPDADKVYRHYDVVRAWASPGAAEAGVYPSLALAAAMAGEPRGAPQPSESLLLNFRGPEFSFEHVKFVNILVSINRVEVGEAPLYAAERFKDKIVLVGINAEGYEDVHPTPLSRVFPGVELHATAIDNLLEGDALRELGMPMLFAAGAACAATAILFAVPAVGWVTLALLGLLALGLALVLLAWLNLLVVPVAAPLLGGGVATGAGFLWRLVVEGRQKREMRRAFSSYLAPEVLAEVLADPARLALGGETREVTLLFTDLAGFTALSEHLEPKDVVAFLNDYFTRMCEPILAERGVIDKFIGDAIMALFGAPLGSSDHALHAVRAGLAALAVSEAIGAELAAQGRPVIETRIGIHSGTAVIGNMGSAKRFDYTAIGDTVNLASRLEGANKFFGTRCLVSESSWRVSRDAILGREVGRVAVKGRDEPIRVFEPRSVRSTADQREVELVAAHAAALSALGAGDREGARRGFRAVLAMQPGDGVAGLYLGRLQGGDDWDGVFRLDAK